MWNREEKNILAKDKVYAACTIFSKLKFILDTFKMHRKILKGNCQNIYKTGEVNTAFLHDLLCLLCNTLYSEHQYCIKLYRKVQK